ncbi:MAG: hypothetical protein MUO94_08175 [Thermoplasmata archaeon]|nr:hypothetical protein [Thermoplasmata archaeon]
MDGLLQLIIVLVAFALIVFLIGRSVRVVFLLGICLACIYVASSLGYLEGIV